MIVLDPDPSPRHWEAAHLPILTKGRVQKELRDARRVGNQCKIKVSGWMEAELVSLKEDTVGELLYVSIRFSCSILEGMDKRLRGEPSLSCREQKFSCWSTRTCVWDGDVRRMWKQRQQAGL